jgi:tetratricopeptide (TPR) repeat protein
VYLNLAACYLAAGPAQDLAKATENANLALEIDGGNTKALYRAGRAHLLLGDLDAAKSKLTKAAKNQPGDKNIREALQQLKDELSAHKAKEKQTWGGRLLADADADTNRSATEDAGTLTNEGDGGHSGAVHGSDGLRFWIMAAMAVVAAVVLAAMHLSA